MPPQLEANIRTIAVLSQYFHRPCVNAALDQAIVCRRKFLFRDAKNLRRRGGEQARARLGLHETRRLIDVDVAHARAIDQK